MVEFKTLNSEFENKKDYYKFFNNYGDDAIKYSLLRSLDNDNIIEFLSKRIDTSNKKELLKNAYESDISIDEIVKYIMSKKEKLLVERKQNEDVLISMVENMDIVNCGIRNDQVDDIIKPFVRTKDFKNLDEMNIELDKKLMPRIRNYVYWSFFNQLSNDLIENSFYSHPSIIPTLRKIHNIDFFIKIDNKIYPFDLKITHISDEFFNSYSEGLIRTNKEDEFISQNNINESKKIKTYYKEVKKDHNLPNFGSLSKLQLLELLKNENEDTIDDKIIDFINDRENMINGIEKDIEPLEWWNYKYQGERLFSNNNRFFVFLVHKNKFEDGKDLKKDILDIRNAIINKLDNLTKKDIHLIRYVYEKDQKVNGDYLINCISILIAKE